MGKRKSRSTKSMATSRKLAKLEKLEKEFTCPFCAHPEAVKCLIDLKERFAKLECLVCNESYWTRAHVLTAPVDVYADWIDACEVANEGVVVRSCPPRMVVG